MTEAEVYALTLGILVAQVRQRRGLKQVELGQAAELSQSMVSRIERGAASPSPYELRQLAGALGLTGGRLGPTGAQLAGFQALLEEVLRRCERVVQSITGELAGAPWWRRVLDVARPQDLAGLVGFVVAVVLAEQAAPAP
jgi:transcriptional regulator with XRE-family HTH domain